MTQDIIKGTIEEDLLPEMITGTGRERVDMKTKAIVEKEEEELELPELKCSVMGSQEGPEGVARRPNVWWVLR